MTFAFWARPTAVKRWGRFIDFGNGAGRDNIIIARYNKSNNLYFEAFTGGASGNQIFANGVINMDQWQHFVITMDSGGQLTIYKDGAVVAEGLTTKLPGKVARSKNYIGHSNWDRDELFQGALDDFRIYDRALTQVEVQTLAQHTPDGK
jgi:hypothetical protein